MKTPAEIRAQQEMDVEIVSYVAAMQIHAPVNGEAITNFLRETRRRRVRPDEVLLRLDYLEDQEYLRAIAEWVPGVGNVKFFRVTARGQDFLDGVTPPYARD